MTAFADLLFETYKACEGRPATVLDRALTDNVRAWAQEQDRLPDYTPEPVEAWGDE